MANILRVMGFCLCWLPIFAQAADYPAPWAIRISGSVDTSRGFGSPASACSAAWAIVSHPAKSVGATFKYTEQATPSFHYCYYGGVPGTDYASDSSYADAVKSCIAGGSLSVPSPGVYVCEQAPECAPGAERDPVSGICVVNPCSSGSTETLRMSVGYAKTINNVNDWLNPGWPDTVCSGQCQFSSGSPVSGSCSVSTESGPPYPGFCSFALVGTGKTCTPAIQTATESAQNPAPIPCPTGTQSGLVNNVPGCYPANTENKTTSTTTDPQTGATTTVVESTACEGEACTQTTRTTVCNGGNCQETTVSRQTSTSSSYTAEHTAIGSSICAANPELCATSEGGGFCAENPDLDICKQSAFGGACGAFTCDGDAVRCAIAREIHEQACRKAADDQTAAEYLGTVAPNQTIDPAKAAQAVNADGAFDIDVFEKFEEAQQTYVSFASECLPPLFFELKGRRYDFDVGFICGIGDFVRFMMHLVAYIGVLSIVGRGFTK